MHDSNPVISGSIRFALDRCVVVDFLFVFVHFCFHSGFSVIGFHIELLLWHFTNFGVVRAYHLSRGCLKFRDV